MCLIMSLYLILFIYPLLKWFSGLKISNWYQCYSLVSTFVFFYCFNEKINDIRYRRETVGFVYWLSSFPKKVLDFFSFNTVCKINKIVLFTYFKQRFSCIWLARDITIPRNVKIVFVLTSPYWLILLLRFFISIFLYLSLRLNFSCWRVMWMPV